MTTQSTLRRGGSPGSVHARNRDLRLEYLELQASLDALHDDDSQDAALMRRRLEDIATEAMTLNDGLVGRVTRRYGRAGGLEQGEDLRQTGLLALWKQWLTWDPDRGELSTFATREIMGQVNRAVAQAALPGRTYNDWTDRPKVLEAVDRLLKESGREPSDEEVRQATGLPVERVRAIRMPTDARLDAPVGEGGEETLGDLLSAPSRISGSGGARADAREGDVAAFLRERLKGASPADVLCAIRSLGLDGARPDSVASSARQFSVGREAARRGVNRVARLLMDGAAAAPRLRDADVVRVQRELRAVEAANACGQLFLIEGQRVEKPKQQRRRKVEIPTIPLF